MRRLPQYGHPDDWSRRGYRRHGLDVAEDRRLLRRRSGQRDQGHAGDVGTGDYWFAGRDDRRNRDFALHAAVLNDCEAGRLNKTIQSLGVRSWPAMANLEP